MIQLMAISLRYLFIYLIAHFGACKIRVVSSLKHWISWKELSFQLMLKHKILEKWLVRFWLGKFCGPWRLMIGQSNQEVFSSQLEHVVWVRCVCKEFINNSVDCGSLLNAHGRLERVISNPASACLVCNHIYYMIYTTCSIGLLHQLNQTPHGRLVGGWGWEKSEW